MRRVQYKYPITLYMHVYSVAKPCPVLLFVTPWTAACQAPLSMGLPRQEDWSGLPFASPRDLPDLGVKPTSPASAGRFLTTEPPGIIYVGFS